jgi:plastocyanin
MFKRIGAVGLLVALLGAGYALAAGPTVTLTANGPQPADVTVNWGDTVTFTNGDNKEHGITIPRTRSQSPSIPAGGTYEHVFDGRRGSYLFRQTGGGPNANGNIVVDLSGTVAFAASSTMLDYGRSVQLTGRSPYPGRPVTIASRTPGRGGDWAAVSTVAAAADGTFALEVTPRVSARYRAQVAADQLDSEPVLISLRPVLRITPTARRTKAGRKLKIIARVNPASAATSVDLEVYDAERRRWFARGRARVGPGGRANLQWAVVKGTSRVRLSVKPVALRGGWTAAISPTVRITGV